MPRSKVVQKKKKITIENIENVIRKTAPGTPLREAINRIQEAELGALIVLGDPNELGDVLGNGFQLNTQFSPQKVYELSKMDGAIILSEDGKTIHGANTQLQPNFKLKTDESGTRHQTAHRVAQQTGNLVITVSERRNKITIYKGNFRYILHDIAGLLTKASQAIMALEKYAGAIDSSLTRLYQSELDNMVTLYDVTEIIRMYALLFKMSEEIEEYILELGIEGRLISIQYEEIMLNQKEGFELLLKDYKNTEITLNDIYKKIDELIENKVLTDENIISALNYDKRDEMDEIVKPRGYRFLRNINKITNKDMELLVAEYNELQAILLSSVEKMAQIKGISKFKAEYISRRIKVLKNRIMLEK